MRASHFTKTCRQERLRHPLVVVLCIVLAFISLRDEALSAPPQQRNGRNVQEDEKALAIREMQKNLQNIWSALDSLRHEIRNHEAETRIFDEKLKNIDTIIDGVHDELTDSGKSTKELLKGYSTTLDVKISTLETKISPLEMATKSLSADLRQFQTHANDATAALVLYKQKIDELEKIIAQQNQNIDHLQAAMRSLMDAMNPKDIASSTTSNSDGSRTYRVKAGDTLEKIARNNQTTIQALKELNGLSNDRIVVDKVLKLPEKPPAAP